MRVLLIGSGGREHALAWKIAQSKLLDKLFCAPGNAGIASHAECLDIKAENVPALLDFARREKIDLTVVGPEAPLALGLADEFAKHKLKVFGVNKRASQLEASKVFAKQLMAKYNVPTAGFEVFDNIDKAQAYIDKIGAPCVVKADGLAQGKGVVVAATKDEAMQAVAQMMREKIFGDAGNKVIIEECLQGQEASIIVFTDSRHIVPLASSQDHKRVFDQDKGPNTGGMGAYSPAPVVTDGVFKEILDKIAKRTIDGLLKEGIIYKGVLYIGAMLTKNGPQALEFNVRFGDPETQAILPRLKTDLLETMLAACDDKLYKVQLAWDNKACVCVVCASGGYPGSYEKGKEISGLDDAAKMKDIVVFHAGTLRLPSTPFDYAQGESGRTGRSGQAPHESYKYLTNGGRVLGVTGLGNTIKDAIDNTYKAVGKISFDGMHYRKDIGGKALKEIHT